MKKLYKIYFYYGKQDGETPEDMGLFEDNEENRKKLISEYSWGDSDFEEQKDFIAGKENYCYFDNFGGDWDDPTGTSIQVLSYEESLKEIEEDYLKNIEKVKKIFEDVENGRRLFKKYRKSKKIFEEVENGKVFE